MMIHRLAWIALISLIVLIFVGAIVRVTGSGLGCPDWPTCWGCLIPPTSADQIDVEALDIEKFKRHAARKGIDPTTITRETIIASFDPVHTWIEYINRLTSLPLGLSSLALAIGSVWSSRLKGRKKTLVAALAWFGLLDVLVNAVMGAMVVRSGLQPGIITLHMALAFLLIIVLVTIIWNTRQPDDRLPADPVYAKRIFWASLIFFGCLFCEGLMGSQLREQTDELAIAAAGQPREAWVGQLSSTLIFKIHRTFSWTLLISGGLILFWSKRGQQPGQTIEPKVIFSIVIAMMLMGIILGHVSIYQIVQVLHVGATAILLAVTWHWVIRLCCPRTSNEAVLP